MLRPAATALCLLLSACAPPVLHRRALPKMGTLVEIGATGVDRETADRAFDAAFAEVDRLERMMSSWQEESQLSAVNAAAGTTSPVTVDRELFEVVQRALELAARTGGAFDPTFAALWGLWTFGDDGIQAPPDPAEVEARRALIDYRKVDVDPSARTVHLRDSGMRLGLGGIAKGYVTDVAAKTLRDHGVRDFVIKAGGELYASGHLGRRAWRVGIQDPRGTTPFAGLDISDAAFDTSGDYERYFMHEGVRYHHIIDPATGSPARLSRSATVLAADATTADALSTALFVLGPVKGMELVEQWAGIEAVIVGADNRVYVSTGLRGRLWMFKDPTK